MECYPYHYLHGEEQRLGMFVHWGLYAIGAWHEQEQMLLGVSREEYEARAEQFHPRNYDPEKWVMLAKEAGMSYICFTTKHHDGFCMWDTKQTDYNIMHTPYGRDVLKELQLACEKHGVGLALYYSGADWHHENAYDEKYMHRVPPRETDEPNPKKYAAFVRAQVTELLTNYGKIVNFFWDDAEAVDDVTLNAWIHELQPDIRINDRGPSEGDFTTPERMIPEKGVFDGMVEAVESVGMESWGYRKNEDYYSSRMLCANIDQILTAGGNYQLNVGPDADGEIPEEAVRILKNIGKWYSSVKESYEGTSFFPYFMGNGIRSTCKGNAVYLHLQQGSGTAGGSLGQAFLNVLNSRDCSGMMLTGCKDLPVEAVELNTGKRLHAAMDTIPWEWHVSPELKGHLHVYGLPIEEEDGYPIVVKLLFDNLEEVGFCSAPSQSLR